MWVRSDELEQQVLEGVQAPAGVPQGPVRAQLCSQEEQPPLLRDGAQRQCFMQLRHTHSVGLILFVSQDNHRQVGLHPQQAVQLSFSQREAGPVGGVHHVHQNVSLPQILRPVPPQVLPATDLQEVELAGGGVEAHEVEAAGGPAATPLTRCLPGGQTLQHAALPGPVQTQDQDLTLPTLLLLLFDGAVLRLW